MDAKKIAKNYLLEYFWFDFVAAVPFELFTTSPILKYSSIAKIIRLLRIGWIYSGLSTQTRGRFRICNLISVLIWGIDSQKAIPQLLHNSRNRPRSSAILWVCIRSIWWRPWLGQGIRRTYRKSRLGIYRGRRQIQRKGKLQAWKRAYLWATYRVSSICSSSIFPFFVYIAL